MRKNTYKISNYCLYFLVLFTFVCSCSTEETVSSQTLDVQTWFEKYEAESPNFDLFQNLEYNWNQAKITTSEDGTETIIVPIIERKKNSSEIWKQNLYLYKISENNYEALIFEIFPDKNSKNSSQSIDSGDFNGYISSWDLKNGFIKAAQFENNKVVQEGIVAMVSSTNNNEQNKMIADPCYLCPEDEKPTGGSGGGFPGIPLRDVVIKSKSPTFPPMTYIPRGPSYGGVTNPSEYTNPPRGGGGGGGSSSIGNTENPCNTAKTTTANAKSPAYLSAKSNIVEASTDGLEHSITLGKDAQGNITQAPMKNGGNYDVKVNTSWPGAFASIHNHPNKTPLSSGDIYAAVTLNTNNSNFITSYIVTAGEAYAIVVSDLAAAKAFTAAYPADLSPNYSPEFPDSIFDEILNVRSYTGQSNQGRTMAIAFILDKHNAGITLMRQDSDGEFKPVKIQETNQPNGTKTYSQIPCN